MFRLALRRAFSASRFADIYSENHIPLNVFERAELLVRSGLGVLADPSRGDLVAYVGDILSLQSLETMRDNMLMDAEGAEVLRNQPLIDSCEVDFDALRRLPSNTLGNQYVKFMDSYCYHAEEREPVHFVDEPQLAYVLTRYRQLHDIMHTAYGMGTTVESEVALKLIEWVHTGLPMTLAASILGPMAVPLVRILRKSKYLKNPVTTHRAADDMLMRELQESSATCGMENAFGREIQTIPHRDTSHSLESDATSAVLSQAGTPSNERYFNPSSPVCDEWVYADDVPASMYDKEHLRPRQILFTEILPWAIKSSMSVKRPMYLVSVEKWFDKPITSFRDYCGITTPPEHMRLYTGIFRKGARKPSTCF